MNRTNFPDNMRRKRTQAKDRQTAWSLLSPESKLSALDRRPGASKKERARIIKHIEMAKAEKTIAAKEKK